MTRCPPALNIHLHELVFKRKHEPGLEKSSSFFVVLSLFVLGLCQQPSARGKEKHLKLASSYNNLCCIFSCMAVKQGRLRTWAMGMLQLIGKLPSKKRFLGPGPKQRTPPTHPYVLGLPKVKSKQIHEIS